MKHGKDRICYSCYKKYKYCPSCGIGSPDTPWMYSFCSENCRDIFDVFNKYVHDEISANDAKLIVDKLDLSNISAFDKLIQDAVVSINTSATETKKTRRRIKKGE